MVRKQTITLSSQDHFILTAEGPSEGDMPSGNIERAVFDNHWVEGLYEESSEHLQSYLEKIAKVPVLTKEKEVELVELIKIGDEVALEEMVHHNLRLVVWAAMKYRSRLYQSHGMELMDLIQEGNLGLVMKAVKRFDSTYGFKFSTYALWWIKAFITRSLDEKSKTIYLPVHISDDLRKYDKSVQKLTMMLLREPSVDEVVEDTKLESEKILALQKVLRQGQMIRIVSHYEDDSNENSAPYFQVRSDDKGPDQLLHEKELRRSLSVILKLTLNVKEYEIFVMRYGLEGYDSMTLEAIGKQYGVTRERIRQIETKAFEKIKVNLSIMRLARGCGIKIDKELYESAKLKATSRSVLPGVVMSSEKLIKSVCEFYGVDEILVKSASKKANLIKPRHVSMYFLREYFDTSFSEISRLFNKIDHTTAIHACNKIENDAGLVKELSEIRKILQPISRVSNQESFSVVSPLAVIVRVAKFYGVKEVLIFNGTEASEVVKTRSVIAYMFKNMLKLPVEEIVRKLGGKTNETVVNWCDEIESLIQSDVNTAQEIEKIRELIICA